MTLDNLEIVLSITSVILIVVGRWYLRTTPEETQNFKTKAQKITNSVLRVASILLGLCFVILLTICLVRIF